MSSYNTPSGILHTFQNVMTPCEHNVQTCMTHLKPSAVIQVFFYDRHSLTYNPPLSLTYTNAVLNTHTHTHWQPLSLHWRHPEAGLLSPRANCDEPSRRAFVSRPSNLTGLTYPVRIMWWLSELPVLWRERESDSMCVWEREPVRESVWRCTAMQKPCRGVLVPLRAITHWQLLSRGGSVEWSGTVQTQVSAGKAEKMLCLYGV